MSVKWEITDSIVKRISVLVIADVKTGLQNNCFWTVGLVGLVKFGYLVKSEESQISDT